VRDKYGAVVKMVDSGDKLKLDQNHVETVIPAPGDPPQIKTWPGGASRTSAAPPCPPQLLLSFSSSAPPPQFLLLSFSSVSPPQLLLLSSSSSVSPPQLLLLSFSSSSAPPPQFLLLSSSSSASPSHTSCR